METTLVIMAAGLGSRFGGIKQLAPVGPNGEIIMYYSIRDALEAGFDRVVFVIRHELERDFREVIGNRVEASCPVSYAYQELDDLPAPFVCPSERVRPFGTGQAVLACRSLVNTPFLVINADDYYGKTAFRIAHDFLLQNGKERGKYCMPGFVLRNTLSDNGPVTRGICRVDAEGNLVGITETRGVIRNGPGVVVERDGARIPIDPDAVVSMNMWALTPDFFEALEKGFVRFLEGLSAQDITSEYMLPVVVDELIRGGKVTVRVERCPDRWFGVTYKEDRDDVVAAFRALHEAGVY